MSKHDDGSAMMAGVGITAVSGLATAVDAGIEGTCDIIAESRGWFGTLWGVMAVPMWFITWCVLWYHGVSFVTSAWTGVGVTLLMSIVWEIKFRNKN